LGVEARLQLVEDIQGPGNEDAFGGVVLTAIFSLAWARYLSAPSYRRIRRSPWEVVFTWVLR
jgi:hypothetical protein